ncbi:hypothetical protein [Nocardiopsis synnemataformans]|uniref:hypothetical protein n=1 Tax=Nocardiopsis synnemataformans TaxID=61305 RepID=UPI003EB752ED
MSRSLRWVKPASTAAFLLAAFGASASAIHSAVNGQGGAAFWAACFAALAVYTLVLTRQYLSLALR